MQNRPSHRKVAVYFVASPLQYLAAKRIAEHFEADARQVLVWYKPGMAPVVVQADWDACTYMPWPRWEPLPGLFGRLRRQIENIHLVEELVGRCEQLIIHSAVFDTEAINYFLRALPKAAGASTMRARILPDGLISTRRYPLSPLKRLSQHLRKLRRVVAPKLNYWCFSGDRTGSDAHFCDRIYVLPGLQNEYPENKTVTLPPLVNKMLSMQPRTTPPIRTALVIGQPLVGTKMMCSRDRDSVTAEIYQWLTAQGIERVLYKGHPKDPNLELKHDSYETIHLNEPLELHLAQFPYDIVAGVRSSGLLFAKQVGAENMQVVAFGWDRIQFKSENEKRSMEQAFKLGGVINMNPAQS